MGMETQTAIGAVISVVVTPESTVTAVPWGLPKITGVQEVTQQEAMGDKLQDIFENSFMHPLELSLTGGCRGFLFLVSLRIPRKDNILS